MMWGVSLTKEEWSQCFEWCSREERILHCYFWMGVMTIRWFDWQIKKIRERELWTGSIHIQGMYLGETHLQPHRLSPGEKLGRIRFRKKEKACERRSLTRQIELKSWSRKQAYTRKTLASTMSLASTSPHIVARSWKSMNAANWYCTAWYALYLQWMNECHSCHEEETTM